MLVGTNSKGKQGFKRGRDGISLLVGHHHLKQRSPCGTVGSQSYFIITQLKLFSVGLLARGTASAFAPSAHRSYAAWSVLPIRPVIQRLKEFFSRNHCFFSTLLLRYNCSEYMKELFSRIKFKIFDAKAHTWLLY